MLWQLVERGHMNIVWEFPASNVIPWAGTFTGAEVARSLPP